jgi:HSP20 family protein
MGVDHVAPEKPTPPGTPDRPDQGERASCRPKARDYSRAERRDTMATIVRRNQNERDLSSALWDPFRLMREMLRFEPYHEAAPFTATERTSDRTSDRTYTPRFDVKETKDAYVFKLDVPGVKDEDINISLTANRLVIAGKRDQDVREENEQYFTEGALHGRFNLAFTVPSGCDPEGVTARLENGVLTVSVAKRAEVQPRRIPISKGEAEGQGQGKEPKARA